MHLYLGYILGEYTEENCPRYLKRENFAKMKKYLKAGKLGLFHGSIEQAIMKNRDENDAMFTVASLLVRDRANIKKLCTSRSIAVNNNNDVW